VESARVAEEKTLALWKIQNDGGYSNLDASSLATLESYLSQTKSLLDAVAGALATGQSSGSVTQSNLDTWRASVGTARTTISTSINKVNTAQQTYSNAQSSLTLAKQDLVVLLSGASTEDVSAEEARVASAQAKVFQYQVEVGKSVLYSPIDGVVTTKDTQLGEIVSANQHIVSVISNRHFQIESNVSELDIGKLLVGQFATTTLDAYGSDVPFPARVIRVDPAETTVENSPAYGIRLEFVTEDARIKSGMTANISIAIAHKDGVLAVPLRTINKDGVTGKRTVSVLKKDKTIETRDITIGLTSPAGMVEVVTGLKEGDLVVLPQGL
jgi:RND family efflux transporter MFP subunit